MELDAKGCDKMLLFDTLLIWRSGMRTGSEEFPPGEAQEALAGSGGSKEYALHILNGCPVEIHLYLTSIHILQLKKYKTVAAAVCLSIIYNTSTVVNQLYITV